MTSSQDERPLALDELASAGNEREVLEAFIELYREIIKRKVAGLSPEQLREQLVPSRTTVGGVIKHLAGVERGWFQLSLAGRSPAELIGVPPDEAWSVSEHDTAESLIADYDEACDQSRQIAAAHALDDCVPHPRMGQVSLRWIYVHIIEETARHAGHADILREQTDGATGFDG